MTLREAFARNLRRMRNRKGWSQEELAYQADVDRTYVSAMERCVYAASLDMIEKLAKALEVEPSIMLETPTRRKA